MQFRMLKNVATHAPADKSNAFTTRVMRTSEDAPEPENPALEAPWADASPEANCTVYAKLWAHRPKLLYPKTSPTKSSGTSPTACRPIANRFADVMVYAAILHIQLVANTKDSKHVLAELRNVLSHSKPIRRFAGIRCNCSHTMCYISKCIKTFTS